MLSKAQDLARTVKARALELGFDRVAVGPADPPEHGSFFARWLEAGHAGEMAYLERSREKRLDPRNVLPGARSVIVVAQYYYQGNLPEAESWRPVSRYAWGRDYHTVMTPKLETLLCYLQEVAGPETRGKVYVDTGPVLERDLAARAGLGWIGKNTMLLHPSLGSWFFLGVILTTAELSRDTPMADHCGSCAACLDACPTEAFTEPYFLDARRCISYLTIELKGAIPEDLRPQMGEWIFGCDVCQEVCPWNREYPLSRHPAFYPARPFPPLADLLVMEESGFRERFKGSPLLRAKRRGMVRNAVVSLANRRQTIRQGLGMPPSSPQQGEDQQKTHGKVDPDRHPHGRQQVPGPVVAMPEDPRRPHGKGRSGQGP